jgi:hypothetical protein
MAAVLSDHILIRSVKTVSGNTPQTRSIAEQLSQTFLAGTPVMLNNGVVKVWDGTAVASPTAGVAGITVGDGKNLASSGAGQPGVFGSVGAPAASPTWGKVPFQASAVNFTPGAPFTDGRTTFELANLDTIFEAQFDDSAGSTVNATTNINMLGKTFGLAVDTTGHWYVDFTNATKSVTIVALHPNDGAIQNGRVWFTFLSVAIQLVP